MNKGFTFVEILVVVSLVAIIAAGLFSGLIFGERTTKSSIVKSDALAAAHMCFSRLDKLLVLCDTIEFPTAGGSADYAILRERSGGRWVIKLSEDQKEVVMAPLAEGESLQLGHTKRTILKCSAIQFANLFGKELRMTLSFANVNEKRPFQGSLDFSRTYTLGR